MLQHHDKRTSERRRQLKAAIVVFNDRHSTIPCSLRDVSEGGARLEVPSANVPDTFELIVELDGLEAKCGVVWRRHNFVGVRFTEPPVRGRPKRLQVIQAPASHGTPTLRRKPVALQP